MDSWALNYHPPLAMRYLVVEERPLRLDNLLEVDTQHFRMAQRYQHLEIPILLRPEVQLMRNRHLKQVQVVQMRVVLMPEVQEVP
jgi:hypothetical protein